MTFVCIVCRELLSNHPYNNADNAGNARGGAAARPKVNIDIVATKCGHVYHLICLNDWFNKQANPRQECPYCKSAVVTRDFQRIFPVGDEETDDLETQREKTKEMQHETATLKNEIRQFENILEETGSQLQDKALALEIMQYEFGLKTGEVETYKEENRQLKETNQTLETKVASLVESQQKEKLSWDKKVGECTRKIISLQTQLEDEKQRGAQLNQSASLNSPVQVNNHELIAEIQEMKAHMMRMSVSPFSTNTPKHAVASQTDFPSLDLEDLLRSLSRAEMFDICMKFLEKEKQTPADRASITTQTYQPVPPTRSDQPRPSAASANIRSRVLSHGSLEAASLNKSPPRETNLSHSQARTEPRRPMAAKRTLNQQLGCVFFPEENESFGLGATGLPSRLNSNAHQPPNQDFNTSRFRPASDYDPNNPLGLPAFLD